MDECTSCKKSLADGEPTVVLGRKGCDGIEKASLARMSDLRTTIGQIVHVKCRQEYINSRNIESHRKHSLTNENKEAEKHLLRSSGLFDYKTDCIFCGCSDPYDGKKSEFRLTPARTFDLRETILQACERYHSEWVNTVKPRVLFISDLLAADVVYHKQCAVNFNTGKQMPQIFASRQSEDPTVPKYRKLSGRPKDEVRNEAFLQVTRYLEDNDDEQTTVNDLIDRMRSFIAEENCEAYSFPYMKKQLLKYFGDRIIITEINGKPNVVTFQSTACRILYDFHTQNPKDPEQEKAQIIKTAAKLIKHDIKAIQKSKDEYPSTTEMQSSEAALEYMPDSLKTLLQIVFTGANVDVKLASIGQAIMQAARPRILMAPLQIGLGVEMHHHFQSKFLIDSLHNHGFCCSYDEVKRYERCASVTASETPTNHDPRTFVQYAADNVDHNIRTLDGKNTFHGMGIIGAFTPGINVETRIKRIDVTTDDIAAVGRINIHSFTSNTDILSSIHYEHLSDPMSQYSQSAVDFLWKISPVLSVKRPLWSGFMQMVHKGEHPQPSSIMFLPMIDLDPNDPTCIFSTLNYVCNHAKRYHCTPVITFDQPLWWKAHMIVESQPVSSELRSVVVRLGGFHAEMSFLGSIGHLMKGSGIEDMLEVIYASNTVGHILSGKAVSRAIRGHFIVDASLHSMLAARVLDVPLVAGNTDLEPSLQHNEDASSSDNSMDDVEDVEAMSTEIFQSPDVQDLADLMNQLLSGEASVHAIEQNHIVSKIQDDVRGEEKKLASAKTASLWLQYMEMIDLLRKFLKAERLGKWDLHLQSLYDMLPYFAASGHRLYLKSVHIYLQKMAKLPQEHPDVFHHFQEGLHVIRRSDRCWSGLSVDLVIEQCLMRSLKTTGGLTRGKGFSESQRLQWVLSMPACAEVNRSMQQLTNVQYSTSEQHREATDARVARDVADTQQMITYLSQRSPFTGENSLRNITTGVTAPPSVNVHESKAIGKKILASMEGNAVDSYTFRKKDQAVTMDTKSVIKIHDEHVQVDPQLLFQRLVTVGTKNGELQTFFDHELCHYPPSLFDSAYTIRPTMKSSLANALWSSEAAKLPGPSEAVQYVLDGGALLHRIPWSKGASYDQIFEQYTSYVTRKYGQAVIVFDGYSDAPSTKDCAHSRRSSGTIGTTVHFTPTMTLQIKKDEFLSNKQNKQKFISYLSQKLEQRGCEIHHARGDADLLIVQTALASAARQETILVGDDTDLLVLLLHHANNLRHNIFLRPESRQSNAKGNRCWNILAMQNLLGSDVTDNILFLHAILGCDTTSGVYGLGKKLAISKIRSDRQFRDQAGIFMSKGANREDVISAGEKALVCLYNGNPDNDINTLRYEKFCVKVATTTVPVQPSALPPTSASVKYHSLRVYHQVQQWLDVEISPLAWGWKVSAGKLVPIMTDLQPAPQKFLEVVRCGCKSGCITMRCSCRKHGMICTMACSECRGICANTPSDIDLEADQDI